MSRERYRRLLGRRPAAEVDSELRFHMDMRVEELVARGMTIDDAQRAVRARMGDVAGARGECIDINRRLQRRETFVSLLETAGQDLRLIARMLGRQRAWTILAVLTLGIGIGATTALFTIINTVLLRPLPYMDPDRLISVSVGANGGDGRVVGEPTFVNWQARARSFSALAAYGGASTVMRNAGEPQEVDGRRVSHGYFGIFGVAPILGRTFTADEDKPGAASVIVLSEQVWRRLYAADSGIIGRTVLLDERPATVVGVMPASFTSPSGPEYWQPYRMRPPDRANGTWFTSVVGRLANGATLAGARAELATLLDQEQLAIGAKGPDKLAPVLMSLHERRYGETRPALLMLFAAVGVLLLIACANVSNLLLARSARRQREFAVRVAIGASMWRLTRFVLCESIVLASLGAGLGLMIAAVTLRFFVSISPEVIATTQGIGIDWQVIAFTSAVALATGVVFGLVPAMQVRRADVNTVLTRGGAFSPSPGGRSFIRRALVVGELATALALLTAGGLLTKSFARVAAIDSGIQPERVLVATVALSYSRYTADAAEDFHDRLLPALQAIPGVSRVALTDAEPLAGSRASRKVEIGGRSSMVDIGAVSPDYFSVVGARITSGRGFTTADIEGSEPVAVINETFATSLFGGRTPVGERHPLDGAKSPPVRIVGVVSDVLQRGVEKGALPIVYRPLTQQGGAGHYMYVAVRSEGSLAPLVPQVRNVVRQLDPLQAAPEIRTAEEVLSRAVTPRRFSFTLLAIFAAIGTLLAAIGLYGVMSHVVEERRKEIGVRIAVGADRSRILRLVVGEGMGITAIGVGIGLAVSIAGVRLVQSLLYQMSIYDPWIFGGCAALLTLTALAACTVPALRATRIDPVTALKAE